MKVFFISLIAFFSAVSSFGQITITAEQGALSTEDLPYTFIKNRGTTLPDSGKNIVWDYSHFVTCDNCEAVSKFNINKDNSRPDAKWSASGVTPVLGVGLPNIQYYGTKDNGDIYKMGSLTKSRVLPLRRFTGHPLDRLKVEDYTIYTHTLEYDFPFEYGKSWKTTSSDTVRFVINAPSINLKNVKIEQINKDVIHQNIIGYGQLKIPFFGGDSVQVMTYDALLIKKVTRRSITFKSNTTDEKLKNILGLAGLQVYSESICEEYKFFVQELSPFIMILSDCSEDGQIERIRLRTDLDKYPPNK